jgi:hypothetical protein
MANLLKGKDAKLRVYGSNGTMTAWLPKIDAFLIKVVGCFEAIGAVYFLIPKTNT